MDMRQSSLLQYNIVFVKINCHHGAYNFFICSMITGNVYLNGKVMFFCGHIDLLLNSCSIDNIESLRISFQRKSVLYGLMGSRYMQKKKIF